MSATELGIEPWLDPPVTASERRRVELARHLHRAREASRTPSFRQRAGEAV